MDMDRSWCWLPMYKQMKSKMDVILTTQSKGCTKWRVCANLSDIVKKVCISWAKTSTDGLVTYINTHTFRHSFHHILTFRHSVFTDHRSMKKGHFHARLISSRAPNSRHWLSSWNRCEYPEADHVGWVVSWLHKCFILFVYSALTNLCIPAYIFHTV